MKTEPITNRCPKCQAPLPANAPQGLCAKCLLAAASTPTEAGQPAEKSPPPPIAEVAAAFPQLQILELIGQGGMGVVYKARQPRLDRLVALKLLPLSLAADAAFAERFNREARVLARLNHPNIVTVHDFGQSGGFFYLLMEFVDGVNLRQAMQAGRFTPQQAMMLVPKICEALQFAHDEGILHRDIKPENILLDTKGRVKIADFGIAKLVGEAKEKLTLTASGQAIGTPHYMAPEQLEHPQDVDQRADIYSLGVVFYEMLTGELPIGRFAPPSTKATVDPRVDDVVFHALEKEREKRFRTAGEVKTSVEDITSHPAALQTPAPPAAAVMLPTKPRRSIWWTFSAWVFVVLGIGALINTLASVYARPLNVALSPGLAHLFAGIAMLTLSRAWRRVALVTLALGSSVILFMAVAIAASPRHASISLPTMDGSIPLLHEPQIGAAVVVLLALAFAWPWYMLLSATGRRLFAERARPRAWPTTGGGEPATDPAPGAPPGAAATAGERAPSVAAPTQPAHEGVTCYFNTPGRMWDCFPSAAARIFTCKGQLALDAQALVFTSTWRSTISIPLADVEDLSVGQFQMWTTPWVTKYARVNFLSVTYRQDGLSRTVHLTPSEPGATTAERINECVGRWFDRVQQAAKQSTGKLPRASDTGSLTVSAEPAWNRSVLPLILGCLMMGIVTWVLRARLVQGPLWLAAFVIVAVLITGLAWCSIMFLRANSALWRGQLDLVTSDDPPVPEPADAGPAAGTARRQAARWARTTFMTITLVTLAIVLLLMGLSYRNRYVPPAGVAMGLPTAAAAPGVAPESEQRLVLYNMGEPVNLPPGAVSCHFKTLLPARHLAHVLFIRWINGAPEVQNNLSGYFKVGASPVDADFALGCQRLALATSANPTGGARWSVNLFGRAAEVASFPGEPPYRRRAVSPPLIVHSGHQGILPLADCVTPGDQPARQPARVELRIFLEPMNYAPVRTDPFEIQGTNFVAGVGPGWTAPEALQAIKEWPIDK